MKKISIVIPNYNGKKLLEQNLPKIIKNFKTAEIIIVDDCSKDNSVAFLKSAIRQLAEWTKVKVLINSKNLGFSSTANKGIFSAKSEFVFLLNNDCCPEKNFLGYILPYFKDKNTFAVSCLEQINNCQRGRGVGGFKKGLLFHQAGKLNKNNTLWAFGASSFYRKSIFGKLGGFDENFNPFYWEDFDLSYRALKSGYKIYFEKKAVIYHQESSTIKKHYSEFEIKKISFRNQLLTCWKNITDRNLIISHFIYLIYHLIFTTLKTKGIFLFGFFDALKKIKKTLNKRKNNKFIHSDKEVLAPFQEELS